VIGTRIGPCELRAELGRGGMGAVYRAFHAGLGREVAVKVMTSLLDVEERERFVREGEALARLDHPAVLPIHAAAVDAKGRPYLVLELIEGRSLLERITREGPLDADEAARVGVDLAEGLAHAHARGVLHRDLKPANVLLDRAGRVFLADFGLARLQGRRTLTASGEVLGTPTYMAPEQAQAARATPLADVYALGATLYHAVTGRAPFHGQTAIEVLSYVMTEDPTPPRALRPDLDPALERVIVRCLAKEPGERFASAAELAAALRRVGGKERARPRPVGPVRRTGPVVGAAVIVLGGAGLGLAIVGSGPTGAVDGGAAATATPGPSTSTSPSPPRSASTRPAGAVSAPPTPAPSPAPSPAPRGLAAEARRLVRAGQAGQVLARLDAALAAAPSAPLLAARAEVRLARLDVVGARRDAEAALARDPDLALAHALRGQTLLMLGFPDEAEAAFAGALERDAACTMAYAGQAAVRLDRADVAGARAALASADAGDDATGYAAFARGRLLMFEERLAEALAPLSRAIEAGGPRASALVSRSQIHAQRGRLADALRDAEAAVALLPEGPGRPAHAPILGYRADVLARDGRFAEARAAALAALRADPLAVAVHSVLVALARREGRPGAVLARWAEAEPLVALTEAWRLQRQGEERAAERVVQGFVDRAPESWAGHAVLAMSYVRLGEVESARQAQAAAVAALPPDHFWAAFQTDRLERLRRAEEAQRRARAAVGRGDLEGAVAAWDAALAAVPTLTSAQLHRARLEASVGDPQEALRALDDVVRHRPGSWEARFVRGSVRCDVGDLAGALDDYDWVYDRVPRHERPDVQAERGMVRADAGDAVGALADLEEALASMAPGHPRRADYEETLAELRGR